MSMDPYYRDRSPPPYRGGYDRRPPPPIRDYDYPPRKPLSDGPPPPFYPKGPRKEEYQDPRVLKERPCATLFVRNVHNEASEEELRALFEQYGEIDNVYNLASTRGLAFLTYFDTRAADKAKQSLQGYTFHGRKLDVHYSLPKEGERKKEDLFTLYVYVRNPTREVTHKDLAQYFGQFGDIKDIRDGRGKGQRFIEFFDSRACQKALQRANEDTLCGGQLVAEYSRSSSSKFDDQGPPPPARGYPDRSLPPPPMRDDDYRGPQPSRRPYDRDDRGYPPPDQDGYRLPPPLPYDRDDDFRSRGDYRDRRERDRDIRERDYDRDRDRYYERRPEYPPLRDLPPRDLPPRDMPPHAIPPGPQDLPYLPPRHDPRQDPRLEPRPDPRLSSRSDMRPPVDYRGPPPDMRGPPPDHHGALPLTSATPHQQVLSSLPPHQRPPPPQQTMPPSMATSAPAAPQLDMDVIRQLTNILATKRQESAQQQAPLPRMPPPSYQDPFQRY